MPFCPLLKLKINLSKTGTGVLWSVQNPFRDQMATLWRCFTGMAFSHSSHGTKVSVLCHVATGSRLHVMA